MILRTLVLSVFFAATAGFGAAQQPRPATRSARLERWVELVNAHQPGQRDAAVVELAGMAPRDRGPLTEIAAEFAGLIRKGMTGLERLRESNPDVERARVLAISELKRTSVNAWLHRAAVLHGDAAILARELTDAANAAAPDRLRSSSTQLIHANDGDVKSTSELNWNLNFARRILDQVEPSPRDDEFVGTWYHATAAFLLSKSWLGELQPHLVRAMNVRPDDPRIVFDMGVLHEAMAMSRVQAVMQTMLDANGFVVVSTAKTFEKAALGHYRRALQLAPGLVEARVRLGRLLVQAGQRDDAVAELTRAINETKDPYLLYHAHLFAARAEEGRGHDADAVAHCREAARLFPGAQSAQVALSLAELRAGNVPAAIAPVDAIRAMRTDGSRDDPWWSYHAGAGRDADALLDALWKAVK